MARSVKKGPYIDDNLLLKVEVMNSRNEKKVVKTWARASTISPDFVGHTVAVHNGNKFIPASTTENMVGHKLGEFAPTRLFRGHGGKLSDKRSRPAAAGGPYRYCRGCSRPSLEKAAFSSSLVPLFAGPLASACAINSSLVPSATFIGPTKSRQPSTRSSGDNSS